MATKIEMGVKLSNGTYDPLHPKTKAEYVEYSGDISANNLKGAMDINEIAVDSVVSNMSNVAAKENTMVLIKENVSVATSAWTSDSTYSDYPYRADITFANCTADHIPDVYFNVTDAESGIFSPLAASYAGYVRIYASSKPTSTITIPTVKCVKGVTQTAIKILQSVYVNTPPTKTTYVQGETLSLAGMVVKAIYSDGSSATVSNYTTSPASGATLTLNDEAINITYTESGITKTTTTPIRVRKPGPTIKPFAECSDAEVKAIVQALQNGTYTTDDVEWSVGDSRTVSLGAFNTYSSSYSSTAQQAAQTATLTILNVGGKTFKGNSDSAIDNKTCNYVIGFKAAVCKSYWASASNNTYSSSLLQTVETNIYNALPSDIKACFKKFEVVTGVYSSSSTSGGTNNTQNRYFTSPAQKEVQGSQGTSTKNESDKLSQFTYYATSANRIKKQSNSSSSNANWWTRSPANNSASDAIYINTSGSSGTRSTRSSSYIYYMAPYGCV